MGAKKPSGAEVVERHLVSVRLHDAEYAAVSLMAAEDRCSMAEWVAQAARDRIKDRFQAGWAGEQIDRLKAMHEEFSQ